MKTITPKLQKAIQALYKDLGWNMARQQGFNRRTCRKPWPQTTEDGNKIYQGLEDMLKRLFKPHYPAFKSLVQGLMAERHQMTAWERDTFLPSIFKKMNRPADISPQMVKKVREIAHKYGIDPGFPSFKQLANAHEQEQIQPGQAVS